MYIAVKDDTVAENWCKRIKREIGYILSKYTCGVEMASRKIRTYQNKAKNLCTISFFVFDLDGECKFVKTKHYSNLTNMFFLAATLVGWIGGDFICTLMPIFDQFCFSFVFFLGLPISALIAILKTPSGSISFNSWLHHNGFRVLFDKIASVYFIWKMYFHFNIGNGQPMESVPIVSADFCSL